MCIETAQFTESCDSKVDNMLDCELRKDGFKPWPWCITSTLTNSLVIHYYYLLLKHCHLSSATDLIKWESYQLFVDMACAPVLVIIKAGKEWLG